MRSSAYNRVVSLRLLLALVTVAALALLVSVVGQRHEARAATFPACSPDYVAQATTDARRVGNEVVGLTALGTWGASACVLHDRLSFAVQPASDRFSSKGVIRSIKGNPGAKNVSVTLRPGNVLVYSWRWRNWCGAHGRFTLQSFWKPLPYTIPSQTVKAPRCVNRGSRSTLSETRPSIRACPAAAYRVTTDLGQPFKTRLINFVEMTLRRGHLPCLVRNTHVTLAVQDESGTEWTTLGKIQGNPGHRTVGTMLTQTYGAFQVFWAWANWCGGGHRFRAFAKVGADTVAGPTWAQGSTCESSNDPSTLTPSYGQ